MKTADVRLKQGFLFAALFCLALAASAGAQVTGFANFCELRLTGCPQDYDDRELTVPLDVVSLSTHVRACGRTDAVESVDGPAVMFVLDHSTSMDNINGGNNDANGNRFRVTKALIDEIYEKAPNSQVGIVVFANGLVFDVNRDANLVKFDGTINTNARPALANQAYMPLMQLDQPAKPRGGTSPFVPATNQNPKAIDVYRAMFSTPANVTQKSSITGGPTTQSGTDISIAFEAALEAFKNSSKSKDNQYIIFLSDGEPGLNGSTATGEGCPAPNGTPAANNPRCALLNSFTAGVGFPTTYTVFLQSGATASSAPPTLIAEMTENVKKNGYSSTNPNSKAWALESNYSNLLNLMMKEIISPMFKTSDAKAKTIIISSAGVRDTTGEMNGNFNFKRQLPMDTTAVTSVSMSIRYDVAVDSVNSATGDTVHYIVPDSLFVYDFKVRRSNSPGANWNKDENGDIILDTDCKERTLDLQFSGTTVIGKTVKGNMGTLDIVFTDGSNPSSVNIEVRNAKGEVLDIENFTLKQSGGKWVYSFQRDVADAKPGDGKLQHAGLDSIILVYRNPNVPLDTLRVAVPFESSEMAFYGKPGDPISQHLVPLPNPDTVKAGEQLDIYAKLFKPDGSWDEEMTNSGKIKWTVSGTPAASLTEDGPHCVFSNETAGGTYTVTATYTDGPLTIKKDITVVVVPGDPRYIEAVTDSSKINLGRVSDTNYLQREKEYTFVDGVVSAVFFAVLRDKYGNYIGMANGSAWRADQPPKATVTITAAARGDASSANIGRDGNGSSDFLYVVVERDGLSDVVHVVIVGEPSAAVGPNPFVPGSSPVMDRLRQLDFTGVLVERYQPIVANSKSGGGNGNADNANGVLVVATAPRPVKKNGESAGGAVKFAMAKAVIYDAVGHIVFESKPGDIILATDRNETSERKAEESTDFGFVWNGKNSKGRTVGPGTYAMRMTATMTNGEKYAVQRMIGVTVNR